MRNYAFTLILFVQYLNMAIYMIYLHCIQKAINKAVKEKRIEKNLRSKLYIISLLQRGRVSAVLRSTMALLSITLSTRLKLF